MKWKCIECGAQMEGRGPTFSSYFCSEDCKVISLTQRDLERMSNKKIEMTPADYIEFHVSRGLKKG
jgi:endogenous inhibitor of DNA gyrase (YacG/DUF329 family)